MVNAKPLMNVNPVYQLPWYAIVLYGKSWRPVEEEKNATSQKFSLAAFHRLVKKLLSAKSFLNESGKRGPYWWRPENNMIWWPVYH